MSDPTEDKRHLDIVLVSQAIANHYEGFRVGQSIEFMQEALRQMYDRAYAAGYRAAIAEPKRNAVEVLAALEKAVELYENYALLAQPSSKESLHAGRWVNQARDAIAKAKGGRA